MLLSSEIMIRHFATLFLKKFLPRYSVLSESVCTDLMFIVVGGVVESGNHGSAHHVFFFPAMLFSA